MKKTTKISIISAITLIVFLFAGKINAEESNTFPVDKAGISAYLKINESGSKSLTEALYFKEEIIEQKETHVIVSFEIDIEVKIETGENNLNKKIYPLIYLNNDGWMVAYFPKEKESSKIMQWTNYSPGNLTTTVLEDALLKMTENINATYSDPIKYYHFSYPEANRMTLVAETIRHPNENKNNFSVIVPGEIHEVSYIFYHSFQTSYHPKYCFIELSVDDKNVKSFFYKNCRNKGITYDFYESNAFKNNTPHLVSLTVSGEDEVPFEGGAATVFIYQVDH